MKLGNWKYNKAVNVFIFTSNKWKGYEVDPDRNNLTGWLEHLKETKSLFIYKQDLLDLERLWNTINPPTKLEIKQ